MTFPRAHLIASLCVAGLVALCGDRVTPVDLANYLTGELLLALIIWLECRHPAVPASAEA